MKTIHAVFEKGVFRPLEAVSLPENTHVVFEPRELEPEGTKPKGLEKIYEILSERFQSGEVDVAARHEEHQP